MLRLKYAIGSSTELKKKDLITPSFLFGSWGPKTIGVYTKTHASLKQLARNNCIDSLSIWCRNCNCLLLSAAKKDGDARFA
jgi:hypothetical protein